MDIFSILERLSAADAPSGFEAPVAALCSELLAPYCDEIHIDPLGSVIAKRHGFSADKPTVLLDAHVDEIGFIITGKEKEGGFLRFQTLGGVDPRVMPASMVKILTEPPVFGVVDVLPPHVLEAGDSDKAKPIEELRLDVGYTDAADVNIPVGTPAVFGVSSMRHSEHLFMGKAMDDRACFASILLALDKLGDAELSVNVVVSATSQEEVGTRGAYTAAYSVHADYAIVADVGFAIQPGLDKPDECAKLNAGGIVSIHANADRALTRRFITKAEEIGVPVQVFAEGGGESGTNARVVQISREGVRVVLVGIPLRYMHTPSETLDVRDLDMLADVMAASLKGGVFSD